MFGPTLLEVNDDNIFISNEEEPRQHNVSDNSDQFDTKEDFLIQLTDLLLKMEAKLLISNSSIEIIQSTFKQLVDSNNKNMIAQIFSKVSQFEQK